MSKKIVVLYKKKCSQILPYLIGVGAILILELSLVILVARIWLDWNQTVMAGISYIALALLLLYWLFWAPMKVPNLLTEDSLIIKYGYSISLQISLVNIASIEETNEQIPIMVPFGLEKDQKSGIMFMNTGNACKLLLKLIQPVELKGVMKNYGYSDKIVFNVDEPILIKKFMSSNVDSNQSKTSDNLKGIKSISSIPTAMTTCEPVLVLDNLTKVFGDFPAVKELNLQFYQGEIFGLLGSNGAGKTTTLKMISGLLKPSKGNIRIPNKDTVAYMPEFMTLYERMSGREFLEFLGVLYDVKQKDLKNQIEKHLINFEMEKAADRPIGSYSQGMKRKISLIATLLKGSSILLLDEPTNGLDPTGIIEVKELLKDLAQEGKTVIVSTHILGMAEQLCDRVGVIAGGTLLFVGSLAELRDITGMEHASLEDIFISLIKK